MRITIFWASLHFKDIKSMVWYPIKSKHRLTEPRNYTSFRIIKL